MMKLRDITYKQVLDREGNFVALEIWQGMQHIVVELKDPSFSSSEHSTYWATVKETVDTLAADNKRIATVRADNSEAFGYLREKILANKKDKLSLNA